VPNFQELQKRIHLKGKKDILKASIKYPILFACFDILYDGKSLINICLLKRKKILEKFGENEVFVKVPYILEKGSLLFSEICKFDLEGVVAKKVSSSYEINSRSSDWIKVKNLKVDSFFVGGYLEKKSTSMFSVYLGIFVDNCFSFVGKVSVSRKSGLLELLQKEKQLKKSPFLNFQDKTINYVKPKYICFVRYLEKSKEGILRHPVFV